MEPDEEEMEVEDPETIEVTPETLTATEAMGNGDDGTGSPPVLIGRKKSPSAIGPSKVSISDWLALSLYSDCFRPIFEMHEWVKQKPVQLLMVQNLEGLNIIPLRASIPMHVYSLLIPTVDN